MKSLLYTLLLSTCTLVLLGQERELPTTNTSPEATNNGFTLFDKNKTQVGGFIGGGFSNGFWDLWAQGRYGRFITDRWSTGVDGIGRIGNQFSSITAGPYTRYFILKNNISPIVEVTYNYLNESNSRGFSKVTSYGTFMQGLIGLSWIGFGQNIGAEFLLNYNLLYNLKQKNSVSGTVVDLPDPRKIGFTYRINYFF